MGRTADVNVTFAERAPIYVVGPVKQPGSYKYAPGMIVLQLVALAGGMDQGFGNTSQMIEGIREMERVRKTSDGLKRMLAKRARLDAERTGATSLQPPAHLLALAGEQEAQTLLANESALLRIDRGIRQLQLSEAEATVKTAQSELQALKRKLAQIDVQREMRAERLGDLQKLTSKGLSPRNGMIMVKSEISDIDARREDLLFGVVQAESRLATAQRAVTRINSDENARLLKAIATNEEEISEAQQSVALGEIVTAAMRERTGKLTLASTQETTAFQIVRRVRDSVVVLPAQETSTLLPGDVLKIGNVARSDQEAGGSGLRTPIKTNTAMSGG